MKYFLPAACLSLSLVSLAAIAGGPDTTPTDPYNTHNYVYFGVAASASFSNWNSTFDGSNFRDTFNISHYDTTSSFADQVKFAMRGTAGINFLNNYGFEGGYTNYSSFNWHGTQVDTANNTGTLKVTMKQRSWQMMLKYFHHYGSDWSVGVLLGTAYVQNRGLDVQDDTGTPATTRFQNRDYWTLAYGLGVEYNIPWYRRMSLTFRYIGMLGRNGVKFTSIANPAPSTTFKIDTPSINDVLFGIDYHILYM